MVEKSEYVDAYRTDVYFFKDIDYIQLDGFNSSDLTVAEGSKVNGYSTLTKSKKVVNQTYLNDQISTIDQIVADKYTANWRTLVDEIGNNYKGMAKISVQFSGSGKNRKNFLLNSTRYLGETDETLKNIKAQAESLNDGKERDITTNSMGMSTTGYVYANVNSMEKVMSENMLPYIDETFLDMAHKVEQQDSTALKIINNDHIFAAFTAKKSTEIEDEDETKALKKKNVGTEGPEKNAEYYDLLVQRVDLLWQYPEITLVQNGKKYSAFLVDSIESGDNKIVVLMIKDYTNVFANENIMTTDVNIQDYRAYEVPKSAIITRDGKTYLQKLNLGCLPEEVEVTISRYDDGKAIMPIGKNDNIKVGMSYKVYP